uniref:PNPLA domain-containing protein n=1 Tax=Rhabditophanes sp. KR3021 TaxID=114890 RepID=A0AC35TY84_9BILA
MHTHTPKYIKPESLSLSFAGCGFLCIYHAGVCAAIKEYAPQLMNNKICGASAGSIAATFLLCNICISKATSNILQVVTQARSRALGALHPSFNLLKCVRDGLEIALPDNAHQLCSGKLFISLTRVRDHENVIVSQYDTREELIQAIICSCFIPFYCGRDPPSFRGEKYVDGGISANQPKIDENSITVSPFSGESDICPIDEDSESFFSFDFTGTNIRFTTRNLYRISVCLIPPSTEICSRICAQGFEDALRYLSRNGFAPCSRCLTIRTNAITSLDTETSESDTSSSNIIEPSVLLNSEHKIPTRKRNLSYKSSTGRFRIDSECGQCNDSTHESSQIYSVNDVESRIFGYINSFRIFKWMGAIASHSIKPLEQLLTIIQSVRKWLSEALSTDYFVIRYNQIFDFLWSELHKQKSVYADRLSYQVVLSGFNPKNNHAYYKEKEKEMTLSREAVNELNLLKQCDALRNKKNDVESDSDSDRQFDNIRSFDEHNFDLSLDNFDSFSQLVKFSNAREAVLSYHYMDEDNTMKVCEIFDLNSSKPNSCKDHTSKSFLSTSKTPKQNGSKAILPNITEESTSSMERFEKDANVISLSGRLSPKNMEPVDSGLSLTEEYTHLPPNKDNIAKSSDNDNASSGGSRSKRIQSHINNNRKMGMRSPSIRMNLPSSDSDADNDRCFAPSRRLRKNSDEYDGEEESD